MAVIMAIIEGCPGKTGLGLSFLFYLGMLWSTAAGAHDPGLSTVELQISRDQIVAHGVFARRDLEDLIRRPIPPNSHNTIKTLHSAFPELTTLAPKLLELSQEGERLAGTLRSVSLDDSDGVHFEWIFKELRPTSLVITAPILENLGRGHRLHVRTRENHRPIRSGLLSQSQNQLEVRPEFRESAFATFRLYLAEGVFHIWLGFDHLLFLATLLMPQVVGYRQGKWRPRRDLVSALKQTGKIVTAFTCAHSLTLILTVLGWLTLPSAWVEAVIAASIVVAAINNLHPVVTKKLWLLTWIFGLIHGMGFAGALAKLGLPGSTKIWALGGFNLGVELGQIVVVTLILPLFFLARQRTAYPSVVLRLGSGSIAVLATVWLMERLS